jgi:hypothetical protein
MTSVLELAGVLESSASHAADLSDTFLIPGLVMSSS